LDGYAPDLGRVRHLSDIYKSTAWMWGRPGQAYVQAPGISPYKTVGFPVSYLWALVMHNCAVLQIVLYKMGCLKPGIKGGKKGGLGWLHAARRVSEFSA
jgi:hypothetical protein